MSAITKGTRVRYTARFAATIRSNRTIDWHKRQGTVTRKPSSASGCIGVMWDGTKSASSEPRGAMEVVSDEK